MKPFRNLKAASLVEEELGKLFARELDFQGALVTITHVEVDEKLLHAEVKVSVLPYQKEPFVYLYLQRHAADLRYKLLKKLNIKPMPFLKFAIDGKPAPDENVSEE